jgi:hypothetical protein
VTIIRFPVVALLLHPLYGFQVFQIGAWFMGVPPLPLHKGTCSRFGFSRSNRTTVLLSPLLIASCKSFATVFALIRSFNSAQF